MSDQTRLAFLDRFSERRNRHASRWMSVTIFLGDGRIMSGAYFADRPIEVLPALELSLDAEFVIIAVRDEPAIASYTVRVGGRDMATVAILECVGVPPSRERDTLIDGIDGLARRT